MPQPVDPNAKGGSLRIPRAVAIQAARRAGLNPEEAIIEDFQVPGGLEQGFAIRAVPMGLAFAFAANLGPEYTDRMRRGRVEPDIAYWPGVELSS